MALNSAMLKALSERIIPGTKIACMGYPDIIYPAKELEKLLGAKMRGLKYREDSEAICKRHGLSDRRIPDADSLFGLLGATLDVFDIVENRGGEIIRDLNEPWGRDFHYSEKYDFVLDIGTLEHCFNIGQAAFNMASLVRRGGTIFHENPFNWGNHGLYNLNPTWYSDFYIANGFTLLYCQLLNRTEVTTNIPPNGRFVWDRPGEYNILAYARRDAILPFIFPKQHKYRSSPSLGQMVPPTLKRAIGA